jgi:hypothetical protein
MSRARRMPAAVLLSAAPAACRASRARRRAALEIESSRAGEVKLPAESIASMKK